MPCRVSTCHVGCRQVDSTCRSQIVRKVRSGMKVEPEPDGIRKKAKAAASRSHGGVRDSEMGETGARGSGSESSTHWQAFGKRPEKA